MFRLIKDDVPQDIEDEPEVTVPQTRVVPPSYDDSHTLIPATWDPSNIEYAYLCERCGVTDRDADTRKMLRLECVGSTSNPLARARIRRHSQKVAERDARRAEADEAARVAHEARLAAIRKKVSTFIGRISHSYDVVRTSPVFWVALNIKGVFLIYFLITTAMNPVPSPAALAIADNIRNHPEEWLSYNSGAPFLNKKRGLNIPNGQLAPFVNALMNGTPVDGLNGSSFLYGNPSQRVVRDAIKDWHDDREEETNAALLAALK